MLIDANALYLALTSLAQEITMLEMEEDQARKMANLETTTARTAEEYRFKADWIQYCCERLRAYLPAKITHTQASKLDAIRDEICEAIELQKSILPSWETPSTRAVEIVKATFDRFAQ